MKRAFASSLLLVLLPSYSMAAFTDFNSLVAGTEYQAGETFLSDGLSFTPVDFNGVSGFVSVVNATQAGGSGLELGIHGIDFSIPIGTEQLSMRYASFSSTRGLIINGVATPIVTKLSQLDGTSVDGVLISAVLNPGQGEQGVLTLNGSIESFVMGGLELFIDDVSAIVPEPSAATLLLIASVITMSRRRRRNIV